MSESAELNRLTQNLAHYGTVFFVVMFLSFILFAQQASAQDRCSAILSYGTFDVHAYDSDEAAVSSLVNWYSSASRKSSGGSVGVSIPGLFGANGSQTSEEAISQSAFQSSDSTQTRTVSAFARTASQTIANAWTECMRSTFGLKVSPRFTSDKNEFYIVFQFQPSNPVAHPSSKVLNLTPGSRVLTCDRIPPGGIRISAAQRAFHCRRSANEPVSVSYRTTDAVVNESNGPIVDFPAIRMSTPQCSSGVKLTRGISSTVGERLFDGDIGPRGINSGERPSDFEILFTSPQWVHHLLVHPIANPPGWVRTQFFGIQSDGSSILFDEQRRLVSIGAPYRVDFDTNRSRGLMKIRVNTIDPRNWVAFSEIEVFVCQ